MALERVPADIRKDGGVARMSDPKLIKEIMAAVTIPVFAKVKKLCRVLAITYSNSQQIVVVLDTVILI